MSTIYQTNLDEAQSMIADLNNAPPLTVPAIGTQIRFTLHNSRVFDLEVVAVVYDVAKQHTFVEMHIPRVLGMSIRDWMDHMRRLREET